MLPLLYILYNILYINKTNLKREEQMIKKWKFKGLTITTFEDIERVFEVDMDVITASFETLS